MDEGHLHLRVPVGEGGDEPADRFVDRTCVEADAHTPRESPLDPTGLVQELVVRRDGRHANRKIRWHADRRTVSGQNVIFTKGAEKRAGPWWTASTLLPSGSITKAAKYAGW